MKSSSLVFRKFVYLTFFAVLCCLVYSSTAGVAFGQKRPGSLRENTTSDDRILCGIGKNSQSEFCGYYTTYRDNVDGDTAKAQKARNRMIDLVQTQIEIYYKSRKDNRKRLVSNLQMVFDILEIGSAAAAGIIKGTLRAKTVIAQALSGFQAGRTSLNKNYDILQTQVLINTMNTNRAEIALSIANSKKLDVDEYTWYRAKQDLTRLLNAGTFSDALDTLVKKTGEAAAKAEDNLKAATEADVDTAGKANNAIVDLLDAFENPATKDNATKIARAALTALSDNPEIKAALDKRDPPITISSEGKDIVEALFDIRGDFIVERKQNLAKLIDKALAEAGGKLPK
jgi:hypothetical protein